MPANKKIGYKKALLVRSDLISALEKCNSANKLIDIEKDYHHKKHVLQLFVINPQFKNRDMQLLKTRDEQIKILFQEKNEQFKKELAKISEKRRLEEQSEQEEQAFSSSEDLIDKFDDIVSTENTTSVTNGVSILRVSVEDIEDNSVTHAIEPQLKIDLVRVNDLKEVQKQLDNLRDKSAEFAGKIHALLQNNPPVDPQKLADYEKAKNAVDSIIKGVSGLYDSYTYGQMSLGDFKTQAKPYLHEGSEHVQTLQSHRGVKEILINLLAAILSGGIIYGIAALAKGSPLVFKLATDSANRLTTLDESIERATTAPCA
ncbi:hypothetical protein [Legionella fallonii]|uniref:Uncharacterized protein n=1 Tax=Legionella fallonii LLAP-10 TaxID=1212491 RepID=A0A098G6L6_9GAMM|nr:hypothetical protein [Legionella fallonii]CEG57631.1 protein of unknown function [Legionella fallonii LLAP-10]